jgi:hypothetical protein
MEITTLANPYDVGVMDMPAALEGPYPQMCDISWQTKEEDALAAGMDRLNRALSGLLEEGKDFSSLNEQKNLESADTCK